MKNMMTIEDIKERYGTIIGIEVLKLKDEDVRIFSTADSCEICVKAIPTPEGRIYEVSEYAVRERVREFEFCEER